MRELWQQSARALRETHRLILLGYSIPSADFVVSGVLRDSLGGRAVRVEIINPEPDPVHRRVDSLGLPEAQVVENGGGPATLDAVEKFVTSYRDDASGELSTFITSTLQREDAVRDKPLLVSWSSQWAGAVLGATPTPDGSDVILDVEGPTSGYLATARRESQASPLTLGELVSVISPGQRLVARTNEQGEFVLVAAATQFCETGYAGEWQVLVPAGQDPRRPGEG
jgi:hypothetical protein